MSIQPVFQHTFDFFSGLPVVVEATAARLTSDAGLLPVRQFDEHIGLTRAFASALRDPRRPELIDHTFAEMVRSRIYGILAGYEDQNDHDLLRHDPVFKLLADRRPDADPLASQPTLSRFENAVDVSSLRRLRDVLIDRFIDSFEAPPGRLTLDLDAVDDPCHGHQQLALFHGHYEQHQYLPLIISSADTDQIVMCGLRFGTCHAALGADDDLAYLAGRLRAVWPDVHICVRGDSGFGVPAMYAVCERLELDFTFGLAGNARLKRMSEPLLARAVAEHERTRAPQRLFDRFPYRAGRWPHARMVVAKAEANAAGTNRRFVVTNRPGAELLPEAAYDEYVMRGESENRHKELKVGLAGDRLSDHRFLANYFRLYLHSTAMNLLVRLRRAVADPPGPADADAPAPEVPAEALVGEERRDFQNRRRVRDPLGEGQPQTWRLMLFKVAAAVTVSARRAVVRLAAGWPFLDLYRRVADRIARLPARNPPAPGAELPAPAG